MANHRHNLMQHEIDGLPTPWAARNPQAVMRPDVEGLPFSGVAQHCNTQSTQGHGPQRLQHLELPVGFPASVPQSAMCWRGEDLSASNSINSLSAEELAEVECALALCQERGLSLDAISQETFPLPCLSTRLESLATEVHNGRGFSVIRGLDPTKYSPTENMMMFAGIASYIGEQRGRQDREGNVLVHIRNTPVGVGAACPTPALSAGQAQPFHNDLGDIIAMYAMDTPLAGGMNRLASAAQVYNEIAATRPDLIKVLAADNWPFENKFEMPPAPHRRPVLFANASAADISFCFLRRHLVPASPTLASSATPGDRCLDDSSRQMPQPAAELPPEQSIYPYLTKVQAEALDTVHFVAAKYAWAVQLERGDVLVVNNFGILHARDAYVDGPNESIINSGAVDDAQANSSDKGGATYAARNDSVGKKKPIMKTRHLVRMWLRNESLARRTPEGLQPLWNEIYGLERPTKWCLP